MSKLNSIYSKFTYISWFRFVLDESLTRESMVMQVCTKITSELKFLYRKNRFLLLKDLRRLLCNALKLIQPHFNYVGLVSGFE